MQKLITRYIDAYNRKDVSSMLSVLSDHVRFENVFNSNSTLMLTGKQAFEEQAQRIIPVFSERKQRIQSLTTERDRAVAEISYNAAVAHDLPNGWKAGREIGLRGVSAFEDKDGNIQRISDYS